MSITLGVMVLYGVATLFIGYWYGRGAGKSYASFHLADRSMSLSVYTLTYMATFTGGGLVMGVATLAYTSGISAQWYAMTQGFAFITVVFVISFLRKFRVTSIGELMGKVFGTGSRSLTAFVTLFGNVLLTAGQTIGMASIVTVLTGIPLAYSFWISAAIFVAITAYGGLKSVARADVFHGIILVGGVVLLVPYAVYRSGGIATVTTELPVQHLNWVGVGLLQIISWYLMYVMTAGASQFFLQRVWAARSTHTAKLGTFLAGVIVLFFGLFTATAGLLALSQGPADLDPKLAFAWTIQNTLPPVGAAILLAAAVAAVMSGADSFLLAGATSFVNDIYLPLKERNGRVCSETEGILVSRVAVIILGLLAALVALSGLNIVPVNTMGMALMAAPIFMAVLFLFWKRTRVNSAVPGIIVGAAAFILWEFVLNKPLSIESAVPTAFGTAVTMYLASRFAKGDVVDLDAAVEAGAVEIASSPGPDSGEGDIERMS